MKALLIVPFWRRPNHLSAVRTERFIRWLKSDGWEIVLVRAGETDQTFEQSWGVEIAIKDPLGLHPEQTDASEQQAQKQYSRSIQLAAALLFNPDPGILWTRRAARHPLVLEHGKNADIVLSSSPPESAHLCAAKLARKLSAKLIIDMRDGWLDEPLKPLLQTSQLQRIREGRLERRILRQADQIFVTSEVWYDLLMARLPFCAGKMVVLTNCCPVHDSDNRQNSQRTDNILYLLYTGKLTLSHNTRKATKLLDPLLRGGAFFGQPGIIEFLGEMTVADKFEVNTWEPRFQEIGWKLVTSPPLPRLDAWAKMESADGLLLISESRAAIPAKLFEYLARCKPVLSVAPKGSAVENVTADLNQFFQIDSTISTVEQSKTVENFLLACSRKEYNFQIPEKYTEPEISEIFLTHVR